MIDTFADVFHKLKYRRCQLFAEAKQSELEKLNINFSSAHERNRHFENCIVSPCIYLDKLCSIKQKRCNFMHK